MINMSKKRALVSTIFFAALGFTAIPTATLAHHGVNGQFDLSKTIVKEGVVTRTRFVNPHSYVYFDVTEAGSEVVNWRCELRSGSLLRRKGWKTEMFEEGTKIRIFGSPAREEPTTCYTETITFEGGDKLFRYGAVDESGKFINTEKAMGAAANVEEAAMTVPDISGEWGEPIADGPPAAYAGRGPSWERTQAAVDVGENWTSADNPRFKCEATNIILDYRFDQMVNKITQSESMVEIQYGFMDLVRKIHIDGAFPAKIEPSKAGYSVGAWDGNKLVVTTKGFAEGFLQVIGGRSQYSIPHSTDMEVVEAFYIDEAGELVREYSINDATYLAVPYKHLDKSVRMDGQYFDFECDDLTVEEGRG